MRKLWLLLGVSIYVASAIVAGWVWYLLIRFLSIFYAGVS